MDYILLRLIVHYNKEIRARMKTLLLTEDQGIQAGTPLSQYKRKIGVYESIPNDKRCELIRKVQPIFIPKGREIGFVFDLWKMALGLFEHRLTFNRYKQKERS